MLASCYLSNQIVGSSGLMVRAPHLSIERTLVRFHFCHFEGWASNLASNINIASFKYPMDSLIGSSVSQQRIVPKIRFNLRKHAFSVAAPKVWNELLITFKSSETIATFHKKAQDNIISNCISTLNLWWSLVLIMTFVCACS